MVGTANGPTREERWEEFRYIARYSRYSRDPEEDNPCLVLSTSGEAQTDINIRLDRRLNRVSCYPGVKVF